MGIGAFFLARLRGPAVWFEDRVVLPLAHRFQRPLRWSPGFVEDEGADGVILWCEKRGLGG